MNGKTFSSGLKYKVPVLVSVLPLSSGFSNSGSDEQKTNFIVIVVDDVGYNDVECFNSRASGISTPNINKLALNGIRFTDWQSAHSISGPSRASILTGRYPSRCGYPVSSNENAPMHYEHLGLPQDEITIPELLKPLGYHTVALGKWHLGENPKYRPLRHGFDEYFGCMHNFPVGVIPQDIYEGDSLIGQEIYENIHDKLTDRAIRTMTFASENNQPFFIYLAHYLAHGPWEPGRAFANDEEWQARQEFQGRMNQKVFPAMIRELDWQIGKLMNALNELGLERNTMIIFVSDNGPWLTNDTLRSAGSAWPLRGSKFNTFEGGHRVPAIISWPASMGKGMVCNETVSSMDILPTVAAIAGAPLPDKIIDGENISPILKGGKVSELTDRELLYFHATNLQAIRVGDWKLHLPRQPHHTHFMGRQNVGRGTIDTLTKPMLFNLESDIEESQDFAEENPEIVMTLLRRADERRKELGDWNIKGFDEHYLTISKDSIIKRPARN